MFLGKIPFSALGVLHRQKKKVLVHIAFFNIVHFFHLFYDCVVSSFVLFQVFRTSYFWHNGHLPKYCGLNSYHLENIVLMLG